ncbi:MAG TPA: transcriptional regulator, partial [Bacteroidia bacterium]|nr:transcriptional regulator [Bacteroidia bacterium]
MKNYFEELNKAFESRIRLGIMSILMVNDWIDFGALKEMLNITDGNLASHITALEKEG